MNTNKKINIKICNKAKNITSVVTMITKTMHCKQTLYQLSHE